MTPTLRIPYTVLLLSLLAGMIAFTVGCPGAGDIIPNPDQNNDSNTNTTNDSNTNTTNDSNTNTTNDSNTNNTNDSNTNGDNNPPPPLPLAPINNTPGVAGFSAATELPGMFITIVKVTTANTDSIPQIGKPVAVTFRLATRDGRPISISDISRFSTYISGPTSHYQRVLPAEGDARKVTTNADGSYTYVFSKNLPTTYAAPYDDSTAFGTADGELTGQSLESGTYSIGIE